jgi:hypothetical protein
MSTNDVPGADARNADELAMGCWAEHPDGSKIFVESTEGDHVVYSIFDVASDDPIEYRDRMPIKLFKKQFSWATAKAKPLAGVKWTWHDKTPFPWDDVIKAGAKDGPRYITAADQLSAAQRVAASLQLRGQEIDEGALDHMKPRKGVKKRLRRFVDTIQKAIDELRP